jgi:phage-related protein
VARKIEVIIAGDAKGLRRAFDDATTAAGSFGRKLGTVAKGAGLALGGIAVGVGAGLVDAFGEAREAEKIGKITESLIRSTGGAAKVTADQVAGLAEAISNKTGIDDEAVQSTANLLLTFTNLRNEAGAGNAVFDRAVGLAQDMATVMGGDAQSSALQLGKALNDPIRGVTALGRAGVQFSEEQKEQIKNFVESGDLLSAQKVILDEVGRQFGGAAEAAATPTDKLAVKFGNLKEQLGTALIPIVDKAATFLGEVLPKAGDKLEPFLAQAGEMAADLAARIEEHWPQIQQVAQQVFATVGQVIQTVVQTVRTHWPEIQRIIQQVLTTVQTIIAGAVSIITTLWNNFGNNILTFVRRVWGPVQQIIEGALTTIRGVVQTITALIQGDWSAVWDGIKQTVSGVWNAIQGVVKTALETIGALLGIGLEIIGSIAKGAWNGIKTAAGNAIDGVVGFFRELPGRILGLLGNIGNAALEIGKTIMQKIKDGIVGFVGFAGDIGKAIVNAAIGFVNEQIIDRINNALEVKISVPGPIPDINLDPPDIPHIPTLHDGGVFHAPTRGGEGLALLRDGERVLTPEESVGITLVFNGSNITAADAVREARWLQLTGVR